MRSRLVSLVALLGLAACSAGAKQVPNMTGSGGAGAARCGSDDQCASGRACVAATCTLRAGAIPSWAIEIRPVGSVTAALTERIGIPASGEVEADRNVAASITFAPTEMSPLPATANVVVSVPSAIPGRPELTFETELLPGLGATALTIPDGVLSRGAIVRLIPTPPADQQSPPLSFAIPTQTSNNIRLTLPDGSPWIHGTLHDAFDEAPPNPYFARAYQQGRLVSNVVAIMAKSAANQTPAADGSFSLTVPAAVAANPIVIELAPQGASPSDPRLVRAPLTLPANAQLGTTEIGIMKLPVYQPPQEPSWITAYGADAGQPPVANALIRAVTELTPQADGSARFLRDGLKLTNAEGRSELWLIPGAANAARVYDIAVIPPAGAAYASRCVSQTVLGPAPLPAILLPRRQRLSGTVVAADGSPVANMTVTASRDPAMAAVCNTATGPTATATMTKALGDFSLALDPGMYQLDFDPPAGAAVPRHTELPVDVTVDVSRQFRLPAGVVIDGNVRDADGQPLPYATVRIFEPRCMIAGCSPPPLLRADTLTDADGHYRVVVAAPSN